MKTSQSKPTVRPFRLSRLRKYLPTWLSSHPILAKFSRHASLILHGSLAMGVRDKHADIDIWMLLPQKEIYRLDKYTSLRFFDISLDGRIGHVSVESFDEMELKVMNMNLARFWDAVSQLRVAIVLKDPSGFGRRLIRVARRSMRYSFMRKMLFHHYVEMRGEHKGLESPIRRADKIASILAFSKTINHAMRAAMVLDSEPPPYDKWLAKASKRKQIGRMVERHVRRAFQLVEKGGLRPPVAGKKHPIHRELRKIREILVNAAERRGIHDRWLREWWLFIEPARHIVDNIKW